MRILLKLGIPIPENPNRWNVSRAVRRYLGSLRDINIYPACIKNHDPKRIECYECHVCDICQMATYKVEEAYDD